MKRTPKFIAAEKLALEIGLPIDDDLYSKLEANNWFWDSKQQWWVKGEEPDPPSNLIKIRIWADKDKVNTDVNNLIQAMDSLGYQLEEKSELYHCRPPKQLEARIYLTFSRKIINMKAQVEDWEIEGTLANLKFEREIRSGNPSLKNRAVEEVRKGKR